MRPIIEQESRANFTPVGPDGVDVMVSEPGVPVEARLAEARGGYLRDGSFVKYEQMFGGEEEYSILGKLRGTKSLSTLVEALVGEFGELVGGAQEDVAARFREMKGRPPSVSENRLRFAFWQEYEESIKQSRQIKPHRIYGGVCSDVFFMHYVAKDKARLLWILCPPTNYKEMLREALGFGLEQLREILDLPVVNDRGKVDTRLCEVKAKIVAMLDVRVNGAPVQRVEQKSVSYSVTSKEKPLLEHYAGEAGQDMLRRRIRELELLARKKVLASERAQIEGSDVVESV
jgi:hypothetical protein